MRRSAAAITATVEQAPYSCGELNRPGVRVLPNGANRGLSYSRNRALAECAHRILVFLDDDVTLTRDTLDGIRAQAVKGAAILGVRLVPVFPQAARPWWLTGGQFHYLGVHHQLDRARTWGACMAVDADLANRHGIRFRDELGRRGQALQSGDDTTFLNELRAIGATEAFLTSVCAAHQVSPERQWLRYLMRRAWWQGRSERRRRSLALALVKEWRRNAGRPSGSRVAVRRATSGISVLLPVSRRRAQSVGAGWRLAAICS
jgi:glycosyltransferase involved in cell wall biosynthesis